MTQHSTTRLRTTAYQSTRGEDEENENDLFPGKEDGANNESDDEWTDEGEEDPLSLENPSKRPASPSESMASNVRTIPRKRGSRKSSSSTKRSRKEWRPTSASPHQSSAPSLQVPEDSDHHMRDVALESISDFTLFAMRYVFDISKQLIRLLRQPIIFFLLFLVLSFMSSYLWQTVRGALLSPFCYIPGISSTSMCIPATLTTSAPDHSKPKWADYSTLVNVQSKSFEQLLENSAGGSALSLEIKKSEMATTDLIVRVKISDLKAKDTLAASLYEFVADAKKTGRSLQKLTSRIGGAVDNIMAVNDYALQSIEATRANEPSPWSLRALAHWNTPRKSVNDVVMGTFEEAMNVLSNNMERLVLEAEHNLNNLNNLEERLATLHEIISREDSTMSSEKSDLLEELWTKLGGNRKTLRNFDHHLTLLKGLSTYRKQALAHVTAALQTLQAMGEDMEDMRERVAAPDLMGSSVPPEVHMKSIQMGLERLREGRTRAKRLEEEASRRILSMNDDD